MATIKTEKETRAVQLGVQGNFVYDTIQKTTDKTGDLVSVGIDNVALNLPSMPADPGKVVVVSAGPQSEAVNVTAQTGLSGRGPRSRSKG